MYPDEKTMVSNFLELLEKPATPWGELQIGTEFFYQRGRTDLVAVSEHGNVIAFEAKLKKWKIALQQAYRNKCFADLSYVLLPEKEAKNASRYANEFIRRGVGLCYISEDVVDIIYQPTCSEPLQLWLKNRAIEFVNKAGVEHG